MLYVATGARLVRRRGPRALRRRRRASSTRPCRGCEERVSVWIDPWTHAPRRPATRSSSRSTRSANGGFGGTGLRQGRLRDDRAAHDLIPFLHDRLHLLGARPGARARRRRRRCCSSTCSSACADSGSRCSPRTASRSCSLLGLTFGFALQTFIIVGGVLRLIPLTGITLPFVSYGGSSVLANFVLLAGLLLVSHRANASSQLALEGSCEPPDLARRGRRRSSCSPSLIVGDDVLAGVGGERPRRPAGQRDPARRRVHSQARQDHRRRRAARSSPTTTGARSAGRRSTSASTRSAASRRTSSATRPRCARGPGSRSPRTTS